MSRVEIKPASPELFSRSQYEVEPPMAPPEAPDFRGILFPENHKEAPTEQQALKTFLAAWLRSSHVHSGYVEYGVKLPPLPSYDADGGGEDRYDDWSWEPMAGKSTELLTDEQKRKEQIKKKYYDAITITLANQEEKAEVDYDAAAFAWKTIDQQEERISFAGIIPPLAEGGTFREEQKLITLKSSWELAKKLKKFKQAVEKAQHKQPETLDAFLALYQSFHGNIPEEATQAIEAWKTYFYSNEYKAWCIQTTHRAAGVFEKANTAIHHLGVEGSKAIYRLKTFVGEYASGDTSIPFGVFDGEAIQPSLRRLIQIYETPYPDTSAVADQLAWSPAQFEAFFSLVEKDIQLIDTEILSVARSREIEQEKQEQLYNFGGFTRTTGSNQSRYWVIAPDGSQVSPDVITTEQSDKNNTWKTVDLKSGMLALHWEKGSWRDPHEFRVNKNPQHELTPQQQQAVLAIEQELTDAFSSADGMSENPAPPIGEGFALWDHGTKDTYDGIPRGRYVWSDYSRKTEAQQLEDIRNKLGISPPPGEKSPRKDTNMSHLVDDSLDGAAPATKEHVAEILASFGVQRDEDRPAETAVENLSTEDYAENINALQAAKQSLDQFMSLATMIIPQVVDESYASLGKKIDKALRKAGSETITPGALTEIQKQQKKAMDFCTNHWPTFVEEIQTQLAIGSLNMPTELVHSHVLAEALAVHIVQEQRMQLIDIAGLQEDDDNTQQTYLNIVRQRIQASLTQGNLRTLQELAEGAAEAFLEELS